MTQQKGKQPMHESISQVAPSKVATRFDCLNSKSGPSTSDIVTHQGDDHPVIDPPVYTVDQQKYSKMDKVTVED